MTDEEFEKALRELEEICRCSTNLDMLSAVAFAAIAVGGWILFAWVLQML